MVEHDRSGGAVAPVGQHPPVLGGRVRPGERRGSCGVPPESGEGTAGRVSALGDPRVRECVVAKINGLETAAT